MIQTLFVIKASSGYASGKIERRGILKCLLLYGNKHTFITQLLHLLLVHFIIHNLNERCACVSVVVQLLIA